MMVEHVESDEGRSVEIITVGGRIEPGNSGLGVMVIEDRSSVTFSAYI